MSWHELAAWRFTVVVSSQLGFPAIVQGFRRTHTWYSCFRSRSHGLVRLSPAPHCPPVGESDHRRSRPYGSTRLCIDQSLRFPEQHGLHGRVESGRQAAEHVLPCTGEELDAVAGGAGGQLQVCAAAASGVGGELCQSGVELLSELGE